MKTTDQYDLIVIGGGTAGAMCAIAAAVSGLKTAVVERNAYLGGMACGSGLTEMNAAGFQGAPLYRGIEEEIFNELIESGHGEYHFAVPMSSNKEVKVDRLRYDPEYLKIFLERRALEAGVELYYETELDEAKEDAEGCQVSLKTLYGSFTLTSRYLADATGNASLVQKLGGAAVKTPEENQLTSTLMFRLSNVDMERVREFQADGQLPRLIQESFEKGIIKGRILAITPIPGSRDVSMNVTRANGDYEDVRVYSAGVADARSQILPVISLLRERVPGMESCTLASIAPILGVRDGRRIEGQYELTIQDLEQMTDFEDSVACGCYPMDIHDPATRSVIWKVLPGVYHIPFRSLLPKGLTRTLAIGKCLCAEKKAFAAVRVMPIMMNVGESAGYLFGLAAKKNRGMDDLSPEEIQTCLREKYNHTDSMSGGEDGQK